VTNSHDELAVDRPASPERNLEAIRKVWEIFEARGPLAATEEMMRISHENVEMRSYVARGVAQPGGDEPDAVRGREEVMAFLRKATGEGVSIKARASSFDVEGDTVAVGGSARVVRPDGSFAEAKLRWTYHFRDGLIDEIDWQPRAGD
jgi:ketosteroid isomerase-like protein